MRVFVVSAVTAVLLVGAVPLAVPGTPRLQGIPPLAAVASLVLSALALLLGVVLLVRERRLRRRGAHPAGDVAARARR